MLVAKVLLFVILLSGMEMMSNLHLKKRFYDPSGHLLA